jgi:hypothetical protein
MVVVVGLTGGEVVLLLGGRGGGGGGAQLPVGQSAGDVGLGKHLTQVPGQGETVPHKIIYAKQLLFTNSSRLRMKIFIFLNCIIFSQPLEFETVKSSKKEKKISLRL